MREDNGIGGGALIGGLHQVIQWGGGRVIYEYDKRENALLQIGTASYRIRYAFNLFGEMERMHIYRQNDPNGATGYCHL